MSDQPARRRAWLALVPIVIFAIIAAIFWKGLSGNPSEVPSALIGQPAPKVTLPDIAGLGVPAFDTAHLKSGKVSLVNVWASWCGPCRLEHPVLMDLAKRSDIQLLGLNYKDEPENARRFLSTLGQPFAAVVADENGRAAVDWGVYGVPETFIVDGEGIIRFKWIGPLTPEALSGAFGVEIEKAKSKYQ